MAVSTFNRVTAKGLNEYTVNLELAWATVGAIINYTNINVASMAIQPGTYAINLLNSGSSSTAVIRFRDAGGATLLTSTVRQSLSVVTVPSGVSSLQIDANFVELPSVTVSIIIAERQMTVSTVLVPFSQVLRIFQGSQNVIIPTGTWNFLIIGGGGGGSGGVFGTNGWRGGGSGLIATGTVSGGAYPLTVGAGGGGSNLNQAIPGSGGGTTTFNGVSAGGGSHGGGGGSGGGAENNSNGSVAGTTGGIDGGGPQGSGVPVPALFRSSTNAGGAIAFSGGIAFFEGSEIRRGSTGGGFYSGGGGQKGTGSFSLGVATNVTGGNGTLGGGGGAAGGGASNNFSGPGVQIGGTGGPGFLAVLTQ